MTSDTKLAENTSSKSTRRKAKDQSGPLVRYNVLRHPSSVLVKQVEVNPDCSLSKKRGGQIPKGSTISTELKPLYKYIRDAFSGGTSQFIHPANAEIGTGIPISPKEYVVEGGVDRTASTLTYVPGPATATFDHDPSDYAKNIIASPEELVSILAAEFPDIFINAAWGGYDSSGSFIYKHDGTEISGRRGFHVVFAIEDATQIKVFFERLFKRLWLLGYGYIHISKDGKALPRTIFDPKVIEPQQPLFAGGAHCIGCEQRRPDPTWHDGGYLITSAMAELSEAEEREYKRIVESAKRVAQSECDRIRKEYLNKSSTELAAKLSVSTAQAKKIVESRLGGTLSGQDLLQFDDHGDVSVAEV
jgi:hypothetical protein